MLQISIKGLHLINYMTFWKQAVN